LPEGFTPEMAAEMERIILRDHTGKRGTCDSAYNLNGGSGANLPQTAWQFLRQFHGDGSLPVFSALSKGEADRRRKEAKAAVKAAEGQGEEAIAAAAKILKQAQIDCAMWSKSYADGTLLERWARSQEKRNRNVYFSPAGLRPMEKPKKGSKADVISLRYLWVDIDPDNDIDPMDRAALDPVREAILPLLENLPEGVPLPTWIIDSGRGIWGI